MASRNGRIKAVIAKNISEILQKEVKNKKIGLISVNEVVVNDDYSEARVYVTFFDASYPYQKLAELKKLSGYVRSSLAKKMDIYKVPVISFHYDKSFNRAASLDEALKREEDELSSFENIEDESL